MYKWNLNVDRPSTHDYFAAGTKGQARTKSRKHFQTRQNNISTPSDAPLVLIADDNPDDRVLMSRALQRAGFRVAEAATGEEAFTAFQELQPQVVVLDVLMPGTGGLGTCRLLRSEPSGEDVLILMFSGLQDAGTMRRAYDAGVNDFLAKPKVAEDYAALASRVAYLLSNRHLSMRNRLD